MRPGAPGVLSVSARARFVCVCVCVCVCVFVCARTSVAQQERAPLGAAECGRRAGAVGRADEDRRGARRAWAGRAVRSTRGRARVPVCV